MSENRTADVVRSAGRTELATAIEAKMLALYTYRLAEDRRSLLVEPVRYPDDRGGEWHLRERFVVASAPVQPPIR